MEDSELTKSEIHYHIRWSDSTIDWKTFASKHEATEHAGRIKKLKESYTIIESDAQCERCKLFKSAAISQKPLKTKQRTEVRAVSGCSAQSQLAIIGGKAQNSKRGF